MQQASGLSPWIRLVYVAGQQSELTKVKFYPANAVKRIVLWLKGRPTSAFPGSVTGVFQSLLSPARIAATVITDCILTLSSSFSQEGLMLGLTILRFHLGRLRLSCVVANNPKANTF